MCNFGQYNPVYTQIYLFNLKTVSDKSRNSSVKRQTANGKVNVMLIINNRYIKKRTIN